VKVTGILATDRNELGEITEIHPVIRESYILLVQVVEVVQYV
jgi:hypothetical protein